MPLPKPQNLWYGRWGLPEMSFPGVGRSAIVMAVFFAVMICFMYSCSCRRNAASKSDILDLRESVRDELISRNADSAIEKSYRLKKMTSASSMKQEYVVSLIYLGQGYMLKDMPDSSYFYFDNAMSLAYEYKDYWALATLCNAIGVYAKRNELDSETAIEYFLKGLNYAEKCDDDILVSNLKCNLALTYYLRKDPDGLDYALNIYNMGKEKGDKYLIYKGASTAAYMYLIMAEIDSARYYADKAMELSENSDDLYSLYVLYGDILMESREKSAAIRYYKEAVDYEAVLERPVGIDVYLSLGKYYKDRAMFDSSLYFLRKGIRLSDSSFNNTNKYLLYQEAADVCALSGNDECSRYYSRLFEGRKDSIFNYEQERNISKIKLAYFEDRLGSIEEKANNKVYTVAILSIILLSVTSAVLLFRHRRFEKRMVEALQKQQKMFTGKSRELDLQLKFAETDGRKDQKMEEIFSRLESLMCNERIYRDKSITREKIAVILSTNKTYISRVVSEFTGFNLATYLNSYRLKEASEILSDKNDPRTIKQIVSDLGFNSVSNFYKLFTAAMGMTPSQFRDKTS